MRRNQARAECCHVTGSARVSRIRQDDESSVRPFQSDYDENEYTAVEWDPPETDSNSLASSVQPFQSDYDENEDTAMDWESAQTDLFTVQGSLDEEAMEWEPSEVKPHPKARNLTSMEEETPMEID
ncbi:hypothetical protein D9C73_009365 [Collichthys lucidus]|uniref:Uncharacterized protein n=1 Tax=Collichthys lucidus TaxID=240159 RepID=A0A4U5UNC9_COLLU|nr:hypothetical protein D9C73_009365 [Collichthys lucidus]